MANPEHIQWLLEGVDSWNERRRRHSFEPDLSGEELFPEFAKHGRIDNEKRIALEGIDLSDANMSGTDLSNYVYIAGEKTHPFSGPNLKGANLRSATLCDAVLAYSDMSKAVLHGADISNANLEGAILTGTDLSMTTLDGVNLREARLTGANLLVSSLVNEKIFREVRSRDGLHNKLSKKVSRRQTIRSIEDVFEKCRNLKNLHPDRAFYFRGECCNGWELRPSVMRHSQNEESSLRERESSMLLELMIRRPSDFLGASTAFAHWVIAQHHGLPTRLLDITRDPLVALFWACQTDDQLRDGRVHIFAVPQSIITPFNSDEVSVLSNFARMSSVDQDILLGRTKRVFEKFKCVLSIMYPPALDSLNEMIQQEKPFLKNRLDPRVFFRIYVVEPQQSLERIRAQSGAFLLSAYHERFEKTEILKVNEDIPIYDHYEFLIPHESKKMIENDLRVVNKSHETLLPGLDETARAIKQGS
ncbi:MAG: FRG domain-containing protein [Rhodothermaceae bacterium]|nr:pentapeptide repeat-containing protein [Bacteroidota bacterium]MXW13874.1 FRG domain-containing protein [Rhodothermaceae bacterium]MYC04350.1 FRG domain-containing protein [Rhodothermaceae bacterium]MYI17637.1 FRG domain-containing protein [Rhodothermaceae bacterium]